MPRTDYLVDTSVLSRLGKPAVAAAFARVAVVGRVAMCAPVAFEIGYSARSADDLAALTERLDAFRWVPVGHGDHRRALELQGLLADRGQHRALSLVDALVAATAETRGLTVLHYDADFELIAALTGQPHEWVVARGMAD